MSVNRIALALMPVSHGLAWYSVLQTQGEITQFVPTLGFIGSFYCLWALYKVHVKGDKMEKGHISMGSLVVASFRLGALCSDLLSISQVYVVAAANALVLLNFVVVVPMIIKVGGIRALVEKAHKKATPLTLTWGYTFVGYILGNIVLWSYTLNILLEAL